MAHSLIELHKAVIPVIILVSFCDCGFHSGGCGVVILAASVCPLVRGLCKLPDGRDWQWIELGFVLVGRAMLSKTLICLSADSVAILHSCCLTRGYPALESAGSVIG